MGPINIKKMLLFINAVDCGSFSKGAEKSFITQSAAVGIIDELEGIVGEELFLRNGKNRSAAPTAKGKEAYDLFLRAYASYSEAITLLISDKRSAKKQKILIQSPYVDIISTDWLNEELMGEHGIRLSVEERSWNDIHRAIDGREDCIALLDGEIKPMHGELVPLDQTEIVVAVPQRAEFESLLSREEIDWASVPNSAIIFSGICPDLLQQTYSHLRTANHCLDNVIEVACSGVLRNCLERGHMPALAPRNLLRSFDHCSDISYLPIASAQVVITVSMFIPYGNRLRNFFFDRKNANCLFL